MKTLRSFVLLFLFAFPAHIHAQANPAANPQPVTGGSQSDTLIFTVYGMDCPGCEGGLEKQVNKISAIKYSKASWIKQELRIVVWQDSVLNAVELENRVKKANFTLYTGEKKQSTESKKE